MRVSVFASGSSGNCTLVSSGDTNILIDAGISMRRISDGLAACALKFDRINGVLITHEHSDHISGLKMIIKYHHLPVYAPHTIANRLRGMLPEIDDCLRVIPVEEYFTVGDTKIRAFHTPHDTDESVGYRIEGEKIFALATDMGHIADEVRAGLLGADTVLIESNHDENMLRYGPYPYSLKRRILSDHGHLSNENCARLARELADNGTARIILGHLSRENNTPRLAKEASELALVGSGAELYIAPVLGCLRVEV